MKNLYIITLLFIGVVTQAQIVDIPDTNFKNALVNDLVVDTNGDDVGDSDADTNNDGEIQVSEAEAVLGLFVPNKNIDSLEGIQSFTNIEILNCNGNQLTSLDFAQNTNLEFLFCLDNQLINLDVSQNIYLIELKCQINYLTNLDITQNSALNLLWCWDNQLNSLDVNQNQNLISLACGTNQLSSLDVTQNINLQFFNCISNEITSLDVSQNTNLIRISCIENQLISLNVKNGNNSNMTRMFAYDNPNLDCIQVDDETATYPFCDIGNYTGWCKDDWAEYNEECILGIEENNNFSFTIYPNPTQNTFFIETQQPIETVKIYNLQGQLVTEVSTNSIDVSQLSAGLYFVKVTVGGKSETKKFVKN